MNKEIFSAIRDVNETLALTNEPGQLVNMSLDTISQVMKVDCCWIHTIDGARRPKLAAERGLTREMRAELDKLDTDQGLAEEIIGLGHRIVVPDLSADGAYGLESFRKAGFRWLVAVPLLTYRVHGILGIASRTKKMLRKETPELVMVIGGLIGAALNKARLSHRPAREKKPGTNKPPAEVEPRLGAGPVSEVKPAPEAKPATEVLAAQKHKPAPDTGQAPAARPVPTPDSSPKEKPFEAHRRRMQKFRGSHQSGQHNKPKA
jgi:signal transduction protein with GAF and PtsI domain